MKTLTMLLTLLVAIGVGAQSKYTTFGPDSNNPEGGSWLNITAINDSGQVLGSWSTNGEAFVVSPGDVWTKNIIKTAPGLLSMNNAATIVGEAAHTDSPFYKPWGQPAEQSRYCGDGTTVNAINTAGLVAGDCPINLNRGINGIYWSEGKIAFPHDPYPNEEVGAYAASLNNLNQIVGWWHNHSVPFSGFFYDSKSKQLNTTFNMPGAATTYPASINDNQEVVGNWVDQKNVEHGFYWNPTAGFSDIDVTGDTAMYLVGINNQSVILGEWQDANTPPKFHCVTIVNGKPTASVNVPHSLYTVGIAINNVGQVVGNYETQEGVVRGFIYTPPK
jgi:probable HAF family extracellular repeat protein